MQKGYEVITCTLGEFDEGLRSSPKSPAILMNLMASKAMLDHFFASYDAFMETVVHDFKELIAGKRFYCTYLKKSVYVFVAFHGFESDLIGRCKAGMSLSLSFLLN